ncbi:MAG TPA: CPBP family intramembrane metalloprotease [Clostridiaceae bacterium]|nr:CPBP family intramembrane metalloprotease [Clostridiaceae bacterium]
MEGNLLSNSTEMTENMSVDTSLRKPKVSHISIIYSLTVLLFLIIGHRVQRNEFYSGILITEFGLILLPALIYMLVFKYDIKKVMRFNKAGFVNLFLIFMIMVFAIPAVGVLNLVNLALIKHIFGKTLIVQPPVADNAVKLLINVLVIGGSAGICEEFLFRGVMQRGFERFGAVKSILLTAFLFGLLHMDFQKLLGTFLLGALIGFIVYRTNSLIGGMFAHFTNNTVAVFASYYAYKLNELNEAIASSFGKMDEIEIYRQGIDFPSFQNLPEASVIIVVVVLLFMFLFCALILAGLLYALVKVNSKKAEKIQSQPKPRLAGLTWLIPGILLIGFMYYAQGLKLLGIENALINKLLGLIIGLEG